VHQDPYSLNDIERTILVLVSRSKTHADVAGELGLPLPEVHALLHSVLRKVAARAQGRSDSDPMDEGFQRLSSRQQQALILLADDKTNAQIALAIGISIGRTKDIVSEILRKLEVSSRTGAAVAFTRWLERAAK
jgi:DNA-binding NarL/FixJ family response regulator